MIAVLKHELSSYFTGLSAYIFGAFMLFFAGIYCMVYNLANGLTSYQYVPGSMAFIFLIIVPVVTMRIIAEEKRQRTDQLLYSLPIRMSEVVLGKYFALLIMMLIPILVMCIYPLILKGFGNVHLLSAYSAMAGFFLLGAALLSIGMFVSSLTDNQAVSAGLCFVVMLVLYFMSDLAGFLSSTARGSIIGLTIIGIALSIAAGFMTKSFSFGMTFIIVYEAILFGLSYFKPEFFENLLPDIFQKISPFERFYTFIDGVFDLTGVVFFLTVTGLFLFMTVQSLEKRRWS